jgi:penicillin amidase
MTSRRARTVLIVLGVLIVLAVLAGLLGVLTVRRSFPQTAGTLQVPGLEHPVEVFRDAMGVPSIYAQTMHDLMMAQGFVQAQDRFWQMDVSRHIGAGRLSEMFGEGQVETDLFLRTLGWRRVAQQEWDAMDGDRRTYLEDYAVGVNAYLGQRSGSALSLEYAVLGLINSGYQPEAWTPIDTISWGKVMAWDLGGNMTTEITLSILDKQLDPEVVALLYPPYPADHPIITEPSGAIASARAGLWSALPEGVQPLLSTVDARVDGLSSLLDADLEGLGSNNWVIAGSRTTTGGPLLANDMHLGIQMPSIWYEMGLHCQPVTEGCPLDVVGFTFPGVPAVVVGHNASIAWGVTNGGPDVQDLYIEKLNPENPNQYEVDGQWVEMTLVEETIQVGGGGSVPLTVRYTRHGPIISDTYAPLKDAVEPSATPFRQQTALELPEHYAIALRWTALEPGRIISSLLALDQATDFDEFQAALCDWTVPSQNFVYADLSGNIGYQYTGRIPIRASGDGSRPVPGWTEEYEWTGDIPCNRMPSVYNPPSGYIATANHAVVGSAYSYPMPNEWDYGYRGQRIVQMILAKDKLSVEDLQAIHGDDYHAMGPIFVPLLTEIRDWATPNQALAADMLAGWDFQNRIDSAPAAVFNAFWRHLLLRVFTNMGVPEDYFPDQDRSFAIMEAMVGDSGWDCGAWCDDPATPAVETRDDLLRQAFADGVAELEELLGKDPGKWTWGALHTATFRNTTLGESGIAPIEALFNRGPYETAGGTSIVNATGWDYLEGYELVSLPSERMIVNLANLPDSLMVHTTGQSGHAYHPNYADMIDAWRLIEYRPMVWTREQAETLTESSLTLTP